MLENFYDEKVTIISSESVTTPDNFFKNGKYIAMNETEPQAIPLLVRL